MKPAVLALAPAAVLAVLVSPAQSQSYGPNEQVLTIGAAAFQSMSASAGYIDSDGYLYRDGDSSFIAPLSLPEGALIVRLCLYANDSDPHPLKFVEAFLARAKLVPGGESPHAEGLGLGASSGSDVGYGYYCSAPFEYAVRGHADVDGDGIPDALVHYVRADVLQPAQNSLGLGGVEIHWVRPVSPPPATPTFGDVPSSDPAFPYIEGLAASGITAGCTGGSYCPDANLTRRQMGVFLAKALGLHWTD
jgi:hypothetical protein